MNVIQKGYFGALKNGLLISAIIKLSTYDRYGDGLQLLLD
jgi:hypothetical protein